MTEFHRLPCSACGDDGDDVWCLAVWVDVRWVSGADPPGAPLLALCRDCLDGADVGPYVGDELADDAPARGPFGRRR